jgi:DEAD/DEAH box helicase domain-containing protein
VLEWRHTTYDRAIMLQPVKNAPVTHPLVSTDVSVSTESAELIDDRLLQSDQGMMAEITMRVCDRTVGYRIGDKPFLYRDLSKTNRHMTSKYREFTTTGILIRIGQRWFRGDSDQAVKNRQLVADALKSVLAREHNVAPAEIRTAHRRIALCSIGGASLIDDAIVVFDSVVGGLRLTAPLFDDVPRLLERLALGAHSAPDDAMLDLATVNRLDEWHSALSERQPEIVPVLDRGENQLLIFAPGTRVSVRSRGAVAERTILAAEFVSVGDAQVLMYRCEARDGAKAWVAHDHVEPLGNDWRRVLWDRSSDQLTELAA